MEPRTYEERYPWLTPAEERYQNWLESRGFDDEPEDPESCIDSTVDGNYDDEIVCDEGEF